LFSHYLLSQITPTKETEVVFVPNEQGTRSINASDKLNQIAPTMSPDTSHNNDDSILEKVNHNFQNLLPLILLFPCESCFKDNQY